MRCGLQKTAGTKTAIREKNEIFFTPNRKDDMKIIRKSLYIQNFRLFFQKNKKILKITILVLRNFRKDIMITPVVRTITVLTLLLPLE
jgi:hypothetical protein